MQIIITLIIVALIATLIVTLIVTPYGNPYSNPYSNPYRPESRARRFESDRYYPQFHLNQGVYLRSYSGSLHNLLN